MNMRILAILFIVLHFASPFFAQDATRGLDNAVKKISDLYSEGISSSEVTLTYPNTLELGSTGKYISVHR